MNLDVNKRVIITNKLTIITIGILENISFLLLYFSSETNLDIEIGKLRLVIVIAKEKVGSIKVYKLIPSIPIVLVAIIFIKRPSTFVISPPIIKMIVDLIKFSFIVKNMLKKIKKKSFLFFFIILVI